MVAGAEQPLGNPLTTRVPEPAGTSVIEYAPLVPVVPTNVAPLALSVAVTVIPAPITSVLLESTVPLMVPVAEPPLPLPAFLGPVIQLVPIDTAPPASTMHMVTRNLIRVALVWLSIQSSRYKGRFLKSVPMHQG